MIGAEKEYGNGVMAHRLILVCIHVYLRKCILCHYLELWASGEPDNVNGTEDCVNLNDYMSYAYGKWIDSDCDTNGMTFICNKPDIPTQEPSTEPTPEPFLIASPPKSPSPSNAPTTNPTTDPSVSPSANPPTLLPTLIPTKYPSNIQTASQSIKLTSDSTKASSYGSEGAVSVVTTTKPSDYDKTVSENLVNQSAHDNTSLIIYMGAAIFILIIVLILLIIFFNKRTKEMQKQFDNELKQAGEVKTIKQPPPISIHDITQHNRTSTLSKINSKLPEIPDIQQLGTDSFVIESDGKDMEDSEEELYSDPGSSVRGSNASIMSNYSTANNFNVLPVVDTPTSTFPESESYQDGSQISDQLDQASNSVVVMEQERAMKAFSANSVNAKQNKLLVITPEMEGDAEQTGLGLMK